MEAEFPVPPQRFRPQATPPPPAAPVGAVSGCASAILSLQAEQRACQDPPYGRTFLPGLVRWPTYRRILRAHLKITAAPAKPIQQPAPFLGSGNSRRRLGYFAAAGKVPRPQAKTKKNPRCDFCHTGGSIILNYSAEIM